MLTTIYDTNIKSMFKETKITKNILRKVLQLWSQSILLYCEKVYKKIDGVSMGSLLAPILANWFVASKKNYQLQTNSKPLFYTRYEDNIFVVTQNETELTTSIMK